MNLQGLSLIQRFFATFNFWKSGTIRYGAHYDRLNRKGFLLFCFIIIITFFFLFLFRRTSRDWSLNSLRTSVKPLNDLCLLFNRELKTSFRFLDTPGIFFEPNSPTSIYVHLLL